MIHVLRCLRSLAFLVACAMPLTALATDGYFEIGYGIKSKAMGGAGVAFPQESLAMAVNPAGMVYVGNRVDFNLYVFQPDRNAEIGGVEYDGNDTKLFLCPEGGFNKMLSPRLAVGVALYGNGGMNTDYTKSIPQFGISRTGVDLLQCFISPSLAYKLDDNNAIGISPIFALQRFAAHGLQKFGIQDAGYEHSYGIGVRIGYMGELTDWLSVGVAYQSPIWTTRFHKYTKLFAEQGRFDIPSNVTVGFAVKPHKTVTIAFDVQEIFYDDIPSVSNDLTFQSMGNGLGSDNGPGFGWNNMTVVKVGVAWEVTKKLTLRAGYNYCTQPIPDDQTYFNVIAPAVVQHHVTAGCTWKLKDKYDVSLYYIHSFEQTVNGSGGDFGDATLKMSQDAIGIGVGWNF